MHLSVPANELAFMIEVTFLMLRSAPIGVDRSRVQLTPSPVLYYSRGLDDLCRRGERAHFKLPVSVLTQFPDQGLDESTQFIFG
jgi:hypothetical protein